MVPRGSALLRCTPQCIIQVTLIRSSGHMSSGRGSVSESVLRPFKKKLISGDLVVNPAATRYVTFKVETAGIVDPHVVGNFHVSGGTGNDIRAVLAEWGECENWMNGHQARVLYSTGKTTNGRVNAAITEPGTYCIGFSNMFSVFSAKTVTADIELRYLIR